MSLRPDLARLQRRLDEMPDRAVIVDQYGDAWQKSGYLGYWYRAFDGDGVDSFALAQRAEKVKTRDLCPACDFDPMAPHNGKGTCP